VDVKNRGKMPVIRERGKDKTEDHTRNLRHEKWGGGRAVRLKEAKAYL